MNLKFVTVGTDKRIMAMWFECVEELDDFVTSLTISGAQNWIANINIDFTKLRVEVTFKN